VISISCSLVEHRVIFFTSKINGLFSSVSELIMECKQFKDFAKDMVDYIGDYLENIRDRCVRLCVYFVWSVLCPLRYFGFLKELKSLVILSNQHFLLSGCDVTWLWYTGIAILEEPFVSTFSVNWITELCNSLVQLLLVTFVDLNIFNECSCPPFQNWSVLFN